eukprot:453581_1
MANVNCSEPIVFVCYAVHSTIIGGLFVMSVNRVCCNVSNKRIKMFPLLKIAGMTQLTAYLLANLLFCLFYGMQSFDKLDKGSNIYTIIYWIYPSLLTIALCSFFIYVILRLHYVFKSTLYEIPKALTVLYLMITIIIGILWAFPDGTIYPIIAAILIPIFGGFLSYSFIHRLYLLILSQDAMVVHQDISLQKQQLSLLQIVTKTTILNVIGIMSYIVYSVFYVIIELWSYRHVNNYHVNECIIDYFVFVLFGIANEAEILCVLLGYSVFNDLYSKMCNYYHRKCLHFCINMTTKKIAKQMELNNNYERI